jgi:hypothetical protein
MSEGPTVHPRDRAHKGTTFKRVVKHTKPPSDQGNWMAITLHLADSVSWRTLSLNASRALFRIVIEHLGHGGCHNGRLIVTHSQFIDHGVTAEYVGDAIDELDFRGLIRIKRGRAGNGTSHPNIYRLTFTGDYEGASATNEWKRFTQEDAKAWSETIREQRRLGRAKVGRKSKTPLRVSEIRPLRVSEIREVA